MSEEKKETPQELPQVKSATTSFYIMGTQFPTMEDCIEILKNNHEQSRQDWLDFCQIWLCDIKVETIDEEIDGVIYLKEEIKTKVAWEEPYAALIYDNVFTNWKNANGRGGLAHESPENEQALIDWVETIPAITVTEAFTKYNKNQEQLMRALTFFDPEQVVLNMDAKEIDTQVITKTQTRTLVKEGYDVAQNNANQEVNSDMFDVIQVTFEDKYTLHKIDAKKLNLQEDAYVVGCSCTSTDRKYYLFVEKEYATDAITAIASTLRDENGGRMTKDQYILLESES